MSETSQNREMTRLRASIGGHTRWAGVDNRGAEMAPAHEGLERRIAADYNIPLDAPDFAVRMANARKAYFGRLALKSVQSRRKAAQARRQARELTAAARAAEAELAEVEGSLPAA